MPIYEYECEERHVTEKICSPFDVPDFTMCKCGKRARRIMSTFNFEFKNVLKLIDEKHKHRIELKREKLAEENYKKESMNG